MRNGLFCTLLGLLASLAADGQHRDTAFILRENGAYYHAIFTEKDSNSLFYEDLASNRNSPWNSAFYREGVDLLKMKVRLSKHPLPGLSQSWHPLKQYKGRYYVYYPSDGMNNNWIRLTDSTLLEYAGGEMLPYALDKVEQQEGRGYTFSTTFVSGERCRVRLYLVDTEKGIGLFEFMDETGVERYQLVVDTGKMKYFPMIVNYCMEGKQEELEFEEPDYKQLIEHSQRVGGK